MHHVMHHEVHYIMHYVMTRRRRGLELTVHATEEDDTRRGTHSGRREYGIVPSCLLLLRLRRALRRGARCGAERPHGSKARVRRGIAMLRGAVGVGGTSQLVAEGVERAAQVCSVHAAAEQVGNLRRVWARGLRAEG